MHPVLVDMLRIANYDPMGFHFPPKTVTYHQDAGHTHSRTHTDQAGLGPVSAGIPRKRFFQLIAQLLWHGYIISFILSRRTKGPISVDGISDDFKKEYSACTICSKGLLYKLWERRKRAVKCKPE